MIDTLLRLVAPHPCLSCGDLGSILCANCKYNISLQFSDECIACGIPTVAGICIKHTSPFQNAWYVGLRKDALQLLVGTYKFNGAKNAARDIVDLLHSRIPNLPTDTIVTWIPTHPRRIRERGYDHMAHLARLFAKQRKLHYQPTLSRTVYFVQHNSSRSERMHQVQGAYAASTSLLRGARYLLLDDVYTTGATLSEAAAVLLLAGAKSVSVAVIVKQPLD